MKLLLLLVLGVISAPVEESNVLEDFSVRYNKFTANVYDELAKTNSGNFVVCPMSAHIILALVHAGAKGETALELSNGLNLPAEKDQIRRIYEELIPHLQGNQFYDLDSANKIYIKHGYDFTPQFKKTAVETFKADFEDIDFVKSDESAAAINKWVEDQTREKIKDLVDSGDFDETTFAVLINAMYFHGKWLHQFADFSTRERDFHINNKDHVKVDMMEIVEDYKYYECSDTNAKFLEMPYQTAEYDPENEISMTFVLPNEVEGLSGLESHLEKIVAGPGDRYQTKSVHTLIPKFKVETTIEFNSILNNLGVIQAFERRADFSEMYGGAETLKISKVLQKAVIEVEEKGTTAAAATEVQMVLESALIEPPERKEFIADHSFIYYIKSKKTGVLFIGRFVGQ